MKNLYVISGVTGMTGSELSRQFVSQGHTVIGFDNFFASSIVPLKTLLTIPRSSSIITTLTKSLRWMKYAIRRKNSKLSAMVVWCLSIVLLLSIQSISMR